MCRACLESGIAGVPPAMSAQRERTPKAFKKLARGERVSRATPGSTSRVHDRAREAGDRTREDSVARIRGLEFFCNLNLGFRFAPPQGYLLPPAFAGSLNFGPPSKLF